MLASLSSKPPRKLSMSWWTSASSMNFSVDAHQIMTSRSQPCSALKRRMSSRIVSTNWSFVSTVRVLSPLIRFTYSASKAAGIGSTDFQEVADRVEIFVAVEHAALEGGFVRVVRDRVPCAKDELVQGGERYEFANRRSLAVGALPEADGCHLGDRADGQAHAALDVLDAGDEGRRHGPEAHQQHAELAVGRRDGRPVGRYEVPGFQRDALLARQVEQPLVPLRGDPARSSPSAGPCSGSGTAASPAPTGRRSVR